MPPEITCACGCGTPIVNHDRFGNPRRFIKGHKCSRPVADRFWEKVDRRNPDECWEWQGYVRSNGYGSFSPGAGQNHPAHRIAHELAVGPIPEGLEIDHLCRNRACVNPDHLEPVTPSENQRRAAATILSCPKGHPYTEENMLIRKGRRVRECAKCNREASRARYHRRKNG